MGEINQSVVLFSRRMFFCFSLNLKYPQFLSSLNTYWKDYTAFNWIRAWKVQYTIELITVEE
jgi:hypothetical protein